MITIVCDRCGTNVKIPFKPSPGSGLDSKPSESMGYSMNLPVPDGGGFRFLESHLCMDCLLELAAWMKNLTVGITHVKNPAAGIREGEKPR